MQKLLLILMLISVSSIKAQDSKLLASCCEVKEAKSFGKCSGDASCTACTNCKYCKHCSKEGGSCGVCTTYTAPVKTTRKVSSPKAKSSTTNFKSTPSQHTYGDKLTVITDTLNVREDAGTNYDVVAELTKGDVLTFLSYDGEWIEVRVIESGIKGYVYAKSVK